jgi:hypothetical protein
MRSWRSPLLPLHAITSVLRMLRARLFWLFLPLAALFAFPALVIALLMWWRASKTWDAREWWSGTWLLTLVCGAIYGGLLYVAHPLPSLLERVVFELLRPQWLSQHVGALAQLWGLNLLLTPACALILEALHPLSRYAHLAPRRPLRPLQAAAVEAGIVAPKAPPAEASFMTSSMRTIPSSVSATPLLPRTEIPPVEPLGTFLGGDLYAWVFGNQVCIPLEELMRHIVVVGEPGFGKTITLLRLGVMAVHYGMQVIYLDLKGSTKTAAQFVAAMRLLGVRRIKVYPQEPYDGWRGDAKTLYNRLMQMVDSGTHPFYHRLTSSLVSLAVHAPCGPPTSSKDLLRRLERNWLYRAYAGKTIEHALARRKIARLVPHLDDLSLTFEGFFDGIAGALDGAWAMEDADAIYIGLDGDAQKEQAALMASYLLEDCAHYAKYRKGPRHALLVLDEFGVLDSANAIDLYERVREPGMSVCASAQSYEGLGPQRKQVVTASSIKILHRCGDPEEIVRYAGEREVPAFSQLLEEEEETAFPLVASERMPKQRTTVHMRKQYAIPVEDVQQLPQGKIALITGGLGAWCQVYPLAIPDESLRCALGSLSTQDVAAAAPPSVPTLEPQPAASMPRGRKASCSVTQSAEAAKPGRAGRGDQGRGPDMQQNNTGQGAPSPVSLGSSGLLHRQARSPKVEPTPEAVSPVQPPSASPQTYGPAGVPHAAVPGEEEDDSPVDF